YVTARALNRYGEEIEISASGLLAKAICHELDHLDGIIYTDKVIKK
ncbi:MAG: peptide deformylase, partial [Clostridia bacterium]|nr:peptide deformylase [Clostridia bacterium]